MTRHVVMLATGLCAASLVGSAMAAVPDPSLFSWPTTLAAPALDIDLPAVPPPPVRKADPAPPVVATPRADIMLRAAPATTAPCPAFALRASARQARQASAREAREAREASAREARPGSSARQHPAAGWTVRG
jgi:hypothetical protein